MKTALKVFLGGALAFSSLSWAATDLSQCRKDVEDFCEGIQKGGGRISRCLEKNMTSLSTPCRESLQGGSAKTPMVPKSTPDAPSKASPVKNAKWDELVDKCEYEKNSFCYDVKNGDASNLISCIKRHAENAKDSCKAFLGL